jgi:hypothetical protein
MDTPRGLSHRIRAWRASLGSAIAGHPSGGSFSALASERMLPPVADRPPPPHARRSEGLLAVAGADGLSDRDAYAAIATASRPRAPPPSPATPLPVERLLRLSEAARTAASLGWEVTVMAAPEERDVLLGDDLRSVAAALRDALAAAAGAGGAPERVLADAFAAYEELTYVLEEFEREPPTTGDEAAPAPRQQREPQAMAPVATPPPVRLPPPPAQPAADTEKPLIEL